MAKLNIRCAPVLLAGCLALAATGAGARTLVYCAEATPAGFDPALDLVPVSRSPASRALFDRLFAFDPATGGVAPALAEAWEVADDGLSVVVKLREGVRFHANAAFTPTRDLGADDVIFTFERQRDPDHPYFGYANRGGYAAFDGMALGEIVAGVERVDDLTVRFRLTRAEAPFSATLAMELGAIQSAEYAAAMTEAGTPEMLDTAPIGTGPFALAGVRDGRELRFTAHADYWAGAPAVDDMTFVVAPDPTVRVEKVLDGTCHAMAHPNPADLPALAANDAVRLVERIGPGLVHLAYNTAAAPLDTAAVRQALDGVLDRDALAAAAFAGAGVATRNVLPPGARSPDEQQNNRAEPIGEDLAALRLAVPAVADPWAPDLAAVAEALSDDLAAAGVRVEIETLDPDAFRAAIADPERAGAALLYWSGGANGDPDSTLAPLLGCDAAGLTNAAHWCHAPFDAAIRAARVSADPDARRRLYSEALAIVAEDVPVSPIAHGKVVHIVASDVRGWTLDPLGGVAFDKVELAE